MQANTTVNDLRNTDASNAALPTVELAMLTFIALLAEAHDCPNLIAEAWSDHGSPMENGKPLRGVSICGAPHALLSQLASAIHATPGSWRFVLRPEQQGGYMYDTA